MLRVLLFLALLFPALCPAQVDTTAISFKEISELRLPRRQQVDSMIAEVNAMSGIKLDTNCLKKNYDLLDKYRNEDLGQRRKLMNQANSYATGWREKVPGRCGAGGPPPICPVDHWYKADIGAAMAEFHSNHRKALNIRMDEIWRAIDKCMLERPMRVKFEDNRIKPVEKNYEPGDFRVIMEK